MTSPDDDAPAELSEAVRRVLGGHVVVLCLCTLLGAAAGYVPRADVAPRYVASARLSLASGAPKSAEESTALADGARAIVTSPDIVGRALKGAGLVRDRDSVARDLALSSLGTSGVARLTALDRDPAGAAAIANAVASELVSFNNERSGLSEALEGVDQKIDDVTKRQAEMTYRLALPQPPDVAITLRIQLSGFERQVADLLALRGRLISEDTFKSRPVVIDRASVPTGSLPSRPVKDGVLGALLGLAFAIAAAAGLEAVRPRLVTPRSVARSLSAPLIGHLPQHRRRSADRELSALAGRFRLASKRAGVERVVLLPIGRVEAVDVIAATLQEAVAEERPARVPFPQVSGPGEPGLLGTSLLVRYATGTRMATPVLPRHDETDGSITVLSYANGHRAEIEATQRPAGAVALVGLSVPARELDAVTDLVGMAGWPLLGVVTMSARHRRLPPGRKRPSRITRTARGTQ